MELKGKVAIVTAASRGIGFAISEEFVKQGAIVYLAVRPSDKNKKLIKELEAKNDLYHGVFYNAFDFDSYQTMIDEVMEKAGKIDILVNNFGYTDASKDLTLTEGNSEDFFKILNTNVASIYYSCKAVIPKMATNKNGGSIVNISSVGGTTPDVSRIAYTTSKAAINSLTRNIATQYARDGIRCNAVLPGFVATDATKDNLPKEFMEIFVKNVPLDRVAVAQDIANAVTFLASDRSSYITGELLPVTGGFGLPTPIYGDMMKNKHHNS